MAVDVFLRLAVNGYLPNSNSSSIARKGTKLDKAV